MASYQSDLPLSLSRTRTHAHAACFQPIRGSTRPSSEICSYRKHTSRNRLDLQKPKSFFPTSEKIECNFWLLFLHFTSLLNWSRLIFVVWRSNWKHFQIGISDKSVEVSNEWKKEEENRRLVENKSFDRNLKKPLTFLELLEGLCASNCQW